MTALPTTNEFQRTMYVGNVANENLTARSSTEKVKTIPDRLVEFLQLPDHGSVGILLSATFKDGSKIFDEEQTFAWIEYLAIFRYFKDINNFLAYVSNHINYDDMIFRLPDQLTATLELENMQFFESGSASNLVGSKCIHCGKNTVYGQSDAYSKDEQPKTTYKCTSATCGRTN